MFDNLNNLKQDKLNSEGEIKQSAGAAGQKAPAPPIGGEPKKEVEDIFAGVEEKPTGGQSGAVRPAATPPNLSAKGGGRKRYIIAGVGVFVLAGAVGAAGWAYFSGLLSSAPPFPAGSAGGAGEQNVIEEGVIGDQGGANARAEEKDKEDIKNKKGAQTPPLRPRLQDSDQDGLTDEEEMELGMDANSVDSDNDGLFDREEVKVYKTNPLNPDTDGDGYLDGEEVKAGYNPNGPGKLYRLE